MHDCVDCIVLAHSCGGGGNGAKGFAIIEDCSGMRFGGFPVLHGSGSFTQDKPFADDGSIREPTNGPTDGPMKGPTRDPTDGPTDGPIKEPSREPTDGSTREHTKDVGVIGGNDGWWDKVQDFSWIKPSVPSPNFAALDAAERARVDALVLRAFDSGNHMNTGHEELFEYDAWK